MKEIEEKDKKADSWSGFGEQRAHQWSGLEGLPDVACSHQSSQQPLSTLLGDWNQSARWKERVWGVKNQKSKLEGERTFEVAHNVHEFWPAHSR